MREFAIIALSPLKNYRSAVCRKGAEAPRKITTEHAAEIIPSLSRENYESGRKFDRAEYVADSRRMEGRGGCEDLQKSPEQS
ncbi:MAG: hypothetical protein WBL66_06700, partial [Candidatus Acidiferrales bacterium]